MPAALAAAHVGHQIEHSASMFGFIAGAIVGLAIGVVAVAAVVATGGAALAVIAAVGGAVASTGGMALTGMSIGATYKNPKGPITTGSTNVFYGPTKMMAARAIQDLAGCMDHGPSPIAMGSDSVFINNQPAARKDDKTSCGGTIGAGVPHILVGAETAQYLDIASEVPEWLVTLAQGMVIVGTAVSLVFGAAAAVVAGGTCGLIAFAGGAAVGMIGGMAGGAVGGYIGEAIGGERGRLIGEALGSEIGGLFGGRLGNRMATGHPVDVATGELFTSEVDFVVPGLVPVRWERFWISGSSLRGGDFGHKWHHPFDVTLSEETDVTLVRMEHGRLIPFPRLDLGEVFYHRAERLVLRRESRTSYAVQTSDGQVYHLTATPQDPARFRLMSVADFNGNTLTLAYGRNGALEQIMTCEGIALNFRADGQGRITAIEREAQGLRMVLMRYDYDMEGNLAAAINGSDVPFRYEYRNLLITRETRRSGLSFYFEWDDVAKGTHARCVKTWGDGDLYWRAFTYDADESATYVQYLSGAVWRYYANQNGLVIRFVTPLGHETKHAYNKFGELEGLTDAMGNSETTAYDDFGRPLVLTGMDGAKTTLSYVTEQPMDRRFFAVASFVDPAGAQTDYAFDANGNLAAVTDPDGNHVTLLRDHRGLPLAIRDEQGTRARYRWDGLGYLVEERGSKGGTCAFEYDAFGRLITETIEGAGSTQFDYTVLDQVSRVRYPDGSEKRMGYDAEGNMTRFLNPVGHETRWEFGGLPFPRTRTNTDGTKFAYGYDGELNLVRLTNEVGETYALEFDAEDRLTQEIGFDGRKQSYAYNASGHLIETRDGARAHVFERDKMGRLLRRDSSDGDWSVFEYDARGMLTAANNPVRKVAFTYDLRGNLRSESQDGLTTEHSYTPRGQRSATIFPDGRYVTFGYDQNGDFDALGFMTRSVINIHRDRMGRETGRSAQGIVSRTEYDPQGRLMAQSGHKAEGTNPVFARSYSYAPDGLINEIKDLARGDRQYQYDGRDQLRAVSGAQNEVFGFDPAGTILLDVESPRDASVEGGRLVMQGDTHYTYDDAGNRVRAARGWGGEIVTDYVYDAQNQLIELREEAGRNRRRVTRFAYDALGRRVSKASEEIPIQAANDPAAPAPGPQEVTWFLWNEDVLLAEGTGDMNGALDPLGLVYVYEPDSFRPAAQIRRFDAEEEGRVYTYWNDHLGTPQELTNEAGELVWQVALKAWGGIDRVITCEIDNNIRFQGQYHDTETGLHYNRFRYYDPGTGAFLNQDPIGLLGGESLAAYPSNPLTFIDPLGLAPCTMTGPYSGKPQRTRGPNGANHANQGLADGTALQARGFSQGTYNRNVDSFLRDNGLNPIGGANGRLRPDVAGFDPSTNRVQMVENVSPSQTKDQQIAKLNPVEAAIAAANPGVTVLPSKVQ